MKYLCAHKAFKDLDHEKYWLIRVTINYSIDCLRKKKKIVYDDNLIMNLQDSNNKKKAILCHVDELDDNNKTIIIMFYYNSMSIEEISKALNISYSAAAKRISRARKKMVEIIEGENNG